MGPVVGKKRKLEEGMRGKTQPKKKFRKQKQYHSSSEEESDDEPEADFKAVDLLDDSDTEPSKSSRKDKANTPETAPTSAEEHSSEEDEEGLSDDEADDLQDDGDIESVTDSTAPTRSRSKRNDPTAFSTSISKILSTKLSQSARQDPVLSRSRDAVQASNEVANERLENKARAKLRADKKEALDRGRVRDVLGLTTGGAGETAEEEKRLRKIAQKGVIKLFNAVRAAQVKGEEAAQQERKKGTIGLNNRVEKVNEVSKQSFLDLINGKSNSKPIEEA